MLLYGEVRTQYNTMHWRIIEHKITLPVKSKHLLFDEHSSDACFVK